MLKFTDPKKYVFGIGTAYATSLSDGSVKFWSDKFQDGNTSFAASEVVNNGGIGNGPAIILYNDPNISVTFTSADYNEYAAAASAGADVTYGAPVETCQTVTASGTSISIDVSGSTPVAGPGMNGIYCYVQEIGAPSPMSSGGVAYTLNPSTGAVTGFTATNGKSYMVTYYETQANASLTTYTTDFNSDVVRFVYRRPIYTNYDPATSSGDLWGWKINIIPYLKLNPSTATENGSQTAFTTTAITGRAISYDDTVVTGGCDDCNLTGTPLMYSITAPCDATVGIDGVVGILGGTVALNVGDTFQLTPGVVVNNKLSYSVAPSEFTFTSASTGVASVGQHTGVLTGVSAGTSKVTISLTVGTTTYTDYIDVTVTA